MRSIHIDNIKGDEVLAKSVYDEDGRVLLRSGTMIRSTYIKKLVEMGIEYLYIQDADTEGIELEDGPVGLITYMRTDSIRLSDEVDEDVPCELLALIWFLTLTA